MGLEKKVIDARPGKKGFLNKISNIAKNKIVQYSLLAALASTPVITGCGGGDSGGSGNYGPVFSDLPDQSILLGESFQDRNLADYVSDQDTPDSQLSFACSSNGSNLNVQLNSSTLSVSPYSTSWTGSETVTCTAQDLQGNKASDQASYSITNSGSPQITSTAVTSATENSLYQYDVDATDPNNSGSLIFTLTQGPGFLSIDPYTGVVEGIPADGDSSQSHNVTVKACDFWSYCGEQSYVLNVGNVSTVSGYVKDILTSSSLQNIEVKLGSLSTFSDSSGYYSMNNVPDGTYSVQVTDGDINYFTYNAGNLDVNKTKDLAGKLANDFKIIPTSFNMDFFNETCRYYGGKTQRIADSDFDTWKVYIDTNDAFYSGTPVTQTMIDYVTSIVENEWPVLTDGKINPTRANARIEIGTSPPAFGTNGYNIHWWNGIIIGGHYEYMNGNEITSSYSETSTSASIGIYRQELMQVLGPRWDSNLVPSILNDPGNQTDYQQVDYDIMKVLYNRPPGNTYPDDNPSTYIINP